MKAALEMTKNMSVEEKKAMLLNGAVAEMFLNKDAGDAGEIQTAEVWALGRRKWEIVACFLPF